MFEFVVGIFVSPFIAYVIYVYAVIGSRMIKAVFGENRESLFKRVQNATLAVVIALVPMLLVIPLFQHTALASGLCIGCVFVFLFTRKPRSSE